MRDIMALFAGDLRWVLWWVGCVKEVVEEVNGSGRFDPRSLLSSNAGFSLLVVRQSGFLFFVSSLLGFGLAKAGCAAFRINFRFYKSPFYVYGSHVLQ